MTASKTTWLSPPPLNLKGKGHLLPKVVKYPPKKDRIFKDKASVFKMVGVLHHNECTCVHNGKKSPIQINLAFCFPFLEEAGLFLEDLDLDAGFFLGFPSPSNCKISSRPCKLGLSSSSSSSGPPSRGTWSGSTCSSLHPCPFSFSVSLYRYLMSYLPSLSSSPFLLLSFRFLLRLLRAGRTTHH